MDIGTAKASAEVRRRIPHRMVDIADPADDYTVRQFQRAGRAAIAEVLIGGGRVVIAGGSGLHFRALVDPMTFAPTDPDVRAAFESLGLPELRERLLAADPAASDVVDTANPRRIARALEIHAITGQTPTERANTDEARRMAAYESELAFSAFGVDPDDGLKDRVASRFHAMVEAGLLDEVAGLAPRLGATASQAVGYKELLPVVRGEVPLEEGTRDAVGATRALVKRQRTWFRRDPRIAWLAWQDGSDEDIESAVAAIRERVSWTS